MWCLSHASTSEGTVPPGEPANEEAHQASDSAKTSATLFMRVANVRVERSAAALTLIEAALSKCSTSLYPQRSYWPRSRSNALLGAMRRATELHPVSLNAASRY